MRLLLAGFFIVLIIQSHGQFSFGVKGGLNVSNTVVKDLPSGLNDYFRREPSLGIHIGVYGTAKLVKKFSFVPEILFSQRGYSNYGGSGSTLRISYLEMPLLLSFSPIKWLSVDAGPNLAFIVSQDLGYDKFDFGLNSGLRFSLTEKIAFHGRYYFGLAKIDEIEFRDAQNNPTGSAYEVSRCFQFGMSYKLR